MVIVPVKEREREKRAVLFLSPFDCDLEECARHY